MALGLYIGVGRSSSRRKEIIGFLEEGAIRERERERDYLADAGAARRGDGEAIQTCLTLIFRQATGFLRWRQLCPLHLQYRALVAMPWLQRMEPRHS